MIEYNLVYKFNKPDGHKGRRCRVISPAPRDRVLLEFDDGSKLLRSKFSVTTPAKFMQSQVKQQPEFKVCPRCNGQGKIKVDTQREEEF